MLIVLFTSLVSVFITKVSLSAFNSGQLTILIDAGHGDPDGGAVAFDGTTESDLNLSIVHKLCAKLTDAGIKCILIRKNSESIYSGGSTIHQKKVSDIRNRVKIAKSYADSLVISVHMNTFPDSSVSGAQVFYKSDSDLSYSLANELQSAINNKFQPDNCKKTKSIPSNVYLFKNIPNDSILIECGFLTNNDDLAKLKSEEFQNDMSALIAEVVLFKLTGSEFNGD